MREVGFEMDLMQLSLMPGTGRFDFLLECTYSGHLYARLERKIGTDASIEKLSFFRFHDCIFVDSYYKRLDSLTSVHYSWSLNQLQVCSDETLIAISRDPHYPVRDLQELRWFCNKYMYEISCLRMFSYKNEKERRSRSLLL